MLPQQNGNDYSLLRVATTFGLGAALRLYTFGVLIGGWLDKKLGTSPWLTVVGVVLGIIMSFKLLIDELNQTDLNQKEKKPGEN